MKIILASESPLKLNALHTALKGYVRSSFLEIKTKEIPSIVTNNPEQPLDKLGHEGGLIAAINRINYVIETEEEEYDYIIAIENSYNVRHCEDVCHVVIHHEDTEMNYTGKCAVALKLDNGEIFPFVKAYEKAEEATSEDYQEVTKGLHKTIGEMMVKTFDDKLNPKDWIKDFNRENFGRDGQIMRALLPVIKKAIEEQIGNPEVGDYIRIVNDFPKPGIAFKDIAPLLGNADMMELLMHDMWIAYKDRGITHIAGLDARGFIFGSLLASKLGVGFIPIRKKGKLPYHTVSYDYEKEYGSDVFEMHVDACRDGDNVLIVDDIIATGGSLYASAKLIEEVGARVEGMLVVCAIEDLLPQAKEVLKDYDVKIAVK